MTVRTARRVLNRYIDHRVGGDPIHPGALSTFDKNVIRSGVGVTRVSRMNRGPNKCATGGRVRRQHKASDSFRMGAVTGSFSTGGLIAVAAVLVGGYLLLHHKV
jgi:hypothetical protein